MNTEPNQPDSAIDKTLAALNAAPPPEGLDARIAARIAAHLAAQPSPAISPSRGRFTPTWWSGAITGAAFALLAVAAVLLLQHKTPPPNHIAAAAPAHTLTITPVNTTAPTTPCAHPAILRAPRPLSAPSPAILLAETEAGTESAAPSHPAPVLPLTAQERALVRLASSADPKVLATINPATEAKLQEQESDEFHKFFAPPAPTPTTENRQ